MSTICLLIKDTEERQSLSSYLKLSNNKVIESHSVQDFEKLQHSSHFDLLVLDPNLPELNGFVLIKNLYNRRAPFIFLSDKCSASEKIIGFELGAEDFITRPYSVKELCLRISNILRRTNIELKQKNLINWENNTYLLLVDKKKHKVFVDNKEIRLTAMEWELLNCLMDNSLVTVSRGQLSKNCLQSGFTKGNRSVDTHVKNLRAKLMHPGWIQSVHGVGYRFCGYKK